MANHTDPAAKSIRETNYQKLVDKGMELETHPHKDIFVEFIKNQDYKWTLESIGSLDLRKSALEDDFEEEEEKDEEDELHADLDAGAHEKDFIIVDKVPQGKEIGIENATVTVSDVLGPWQNVLYTCTGLVADMSLVGVFYAVASGSQLRQRTQMRA